jgi:hypothetical protein
MQMKLHCKVADMSAKGPEAMFQFPAAAHIRCQMWTILDLKHQTLPSCGRALVGQAI